MSLNLQPFITDDCKNSKLADFLEDRKNVAEISNGGILMKSDALTAEQLADLNKKLQESLKAQVCFPDKVVVILICYCLGSC